LNGDAQEISVGADVDVRELMREIREEVERKRQAGLYPPDLLEELDTVPGSDALADADEALNRAMVLLRQSAMFTSIVETGSQIPLVAPAAAMYKRAIAKSTGWYISAVLSQVQQFAGQTIRVMAMLTDRIQQLDERVQLELGAELRALRDESRTETTALQQRVDALEREVAAGRARERLALIERAVRALEQRMAGGTEPAAATVSAPAPGRPGSERVELDLDYVDFENHFRGSEDAIRERQQSYIDVFRDAPGRVVDLGCGRGEFLELLTQAGVDCYGVDRNPGMVARCAEKGLTAYDGDLLDHLASVPKGSLGGLFSAQTIEHLDIRDVPRMFELAADAIAPGGKLVIETVNPESLMVFASAFYVDLGHTRPLHPVTLRFLAEKNAFRDVEIRYSSTPGDDLRLRELEPTGDERLDALISAENENMRKLNNIVFGPQDYAVVATR
jgi:SAM-dependent methyltransferase